MKKPIFKSVTVGVFAIATSLIAILRDRLVASEFGIGGQVDIFFLAVTIITFGLGIFSSLSNNGFMPIFIKRQDKALVRNVVFMHLAFSILLMLAIVITWILLDKNYFEIIFITVLALPIFAISSVLSSILQSQKKYFFINFISLVPNLACILLIIMFKNHGIVMASLGLVFGYVIIFLLLISEPSISEIKLFSSVKKHSHAIAEVINNYKALFVGIVIMSSNSVIDQMMAFSIGEGSVSALALGGRVTGLIFGIVTTIMTTILLTEFTLKIKERNFSFLRSLVRRVEKFVLVSGILISSLIFYYSTPIISILFDHGAVLDSDLNTISLVQKAYIIQIPFYAAGLIYANLFIAKGLAVILTKTAAFNLILNIGLNYALGSLFGVIGIATATTLVYIFTYIYLKILSKKLVENELQSV